MLTVGSAADRAGARRVFVLGLAGYLVAMALAWITIRGARQRTRRVR
jgi:hypothetical protein